MSLICDRYNKGSGSPGIFEPIDDFRYLPFHSFNSTVSMLLQDVVLYKTLSFFVNTKKRQIGFKISTAYWCIGDASNDKSSSSFYYLDDKTPARCCHQAERKHR